jgi:hypothetical protein
VEGNYRIGCKVKGKKISGSGERVRWEAHILAKNLNKEEVKKWESVKYPVSTRIILSSMFPASSADTIRKHCSEQADIDFTLSFEEFDPYQVNGKCYIFNLVELSQRINRGTALFSNGEKYFHLFLNNKFDKGLVKSSVYSGLVAGKKPFEYKNVLGAKKIVPSGLTLFSRDLTQ